MSFPSLTDLVSSKTSMIYIFKKHMNFYNEGYLQNYMQLNKNNTHMFRSRTVKLSTRLWSSPVSTTTDSPSMTRYKKDQFMAFIFKAGK